MLVIFKKDRNNVFVLQFNIWFYGIHRKNHPNKSTNSLNSILRKFMFGIYISSETIVGSILERKTDRKYSGCRSDGRYLVSGARAGDSETRATGQAGTENIRAGVGSYNIQSVSVCECAPTRKHPGDTILLGNL